MKKVLKSIFAGRHRFMCVCAIFAAVLTIGALASGSGINQWPGGRISNRLDTHYGQVAVNAPMIPLYKDSGCTKPIGHYLLAGDWVVMYPSGAVTYPITVAQNGGEDEGLTYTTHYIHASDRKYVVNGTGNFSGTDWNVNAWYNGLPTRIGYTSKFPGNGDTVYVGNNLGDFQIIYTDCGYYELWTGDWSDRVMSSKINQYCYYDKNHTDPTDADYTWDRTSQPWSTDGLTQGKNTVYFAGMDASGNFATGKRQFNYDTLKPIPTCSYDLQKGIITVNADDDRHLGANTYSGLDYYRYRLSKNNGKTWTGWSSCYTSSYNIALTEPGIYSVQVMAYDNAGNIGINQYNGLIKRSLPTPVTNNNTFHTGIDVITSINIKNSCSVDILPSDNFSVKLDIPGITTQTKTFVIPGNSSELIWFKWHTPAKPGKITATYTIHTDTKDIRASAVYTIEEIAERTPPDPKAIDKIPTDFYISNPTGKSSSTLSWSQWNYQSGSFRHVTYTAKLVSTLKINPDVNCPTAFTDNQGILSIKSGYGISEQVGTKVITTSQADCVTEAQNTEGFYPEFMYKDYFRLFEMQTKGLFQLAENKYSMYDSRVHFVPLWFPDGDYIAQVYTFDSYTPAGMLTNYTTKTIHIKGNVFDDWRVEPGM